MKAIFLLATLLLNGTPPPAIPCHPKIAIDIGAIHNPPSVNADFNREQLLDLAQKMHRMGKHMPLGFYFGRFGYTINVHLVSPRTDCPTGVAIALTMGLFDRHIEIANDIPRGSCLYQTVLAHYRRHADADDRVFSQYALSVERALHNAPSNEILGNPPAATSAQKIKRSIRSIVEAALTSYNADRGATSNAVDTPHEINQFAHSCATN